MIKEMCGSVSFKRGEALYRANKVTIEQDLPDHCEATVTGVEDFHVTIEKDERGGFRTSLQLSNACFLSKGLPAYCSRITVDV